MTTKGSCYCGAVTLEIEGDPAAQLICHCNDCSKWGSLNLAVLYPRDNVKVTGDLDAFSKPKDGKPNEGCIRKTCAKCHCNVLVDHPPMGLMDVKASILDGKSFEPQMHIFYSEKRWAVKDGLPKFKNMPKDFGGDGETMEE